VVSYESIHPHNAVAIKEKAEVTESSAKSNDQEHRIVLNPTAARGKAGRIFPQLLSILHEVGIKTLVEITERPAMVTCLQQD